MICAQKFTLPRPLQWIAAFLLGLTVWVPVLIVALSYGVAGEMDYRNEQRIEADRVASCIKTNGIGDCAGLPKTNHWRN